MRKYFFIMVFFAPFEISYSQNAVISLDKINILYVGIDNPIEFAGNNYDCKNVMLKSENLFVKYIQDCKCIVRPINEGISTLIIINQKDERIDSVIFRSMPIKSIIPVVDGFSGGRIHHSMPSYWNELKLEMINFDFEDQFKIVSFSVYLKKNDGTSVCINNEGSTFTPELKLLMKEVKQGDIIYFEDVKTEDQYNYTGEVPSIAFKVE